MSSDNSWHLLVHSISTVDEYTIEEIAAAGEGRKVEFKLKLPPAPILASVMAAFANSEGGIILIGIREDGIIQGMDEQGQKRFFETINRAVSKIKPRLKSLSFGLKEYKDKKVGVILAWHEGKRPLVIEGDFYKRLGSQNLKLGREDFLRINTIRPVAFARKEPRFVSLQVNESDINDFMDISDEDAFCEVLLVPFLRKIGFRSVQRKGHRDKSLEFGQDLRSFKLELPTGHWLYFAAQIKTEDLIYSPSKRAGKKNIDTVITQLGLAFGREMFDYETNTKVLPDHVLFVSSGNINEGARDYMEDMLSRGKQRRILTLNRDSLIERILKMGLPEGCQIAMKKYVATKERVN